ncbi:MAG TPA: CpaD family pilus assembly lipoprotein [Stellaceae bacterium]|jgi:pilus assembly protein CpaD|nr:CpaD family pilus assembly lipoprotein [Stellaceae bacterium]
MKARLILCLALACGALQACDSPGEWSPAEAPKQLRVDFQRLTHTAGFAPSSTQLAPSEQQSLSTFLQTAQVTTDDPVYLEAVAGDRLGASRIGALARDLTRKGYSVASLPAAADAVPPNTLLVVVERYVVTPPDCPNWTKSQSGDHDNATSSNFGCSSITNLGLMVADPRDLVIARQLGPASAAQAGLAIQRYRAGQTSPLPTDSTSSTYNVTVNQSGGSSGGSNPGQ